MRKIKTFKLFESNSNNIEREDLLEDVKSLVYILEDEGYDIKYYYIYSVIEKGNLYIKNIHPNRIDDNIMSGRFIGIDIIVSGKEDLDNFNFCLNRFQRLLKEHLDYVSDVKFKTESTFISEPLKVGRIRIKI